MSRCWTRVPDTSSSFDSSGGSTSDEDSDDLQFSQVLEVESSPTRRRVTISMASPCHASMDAAGRVLSGGGGNPNSPKNQPKRRSIIASEFGVNAPRKPQVPVNELPDLTERIQKMGKLKEYLEFKQGYLKWRSGGSTGAKGSIFIEHSVKDKDQPWYAEGETWSFNNTCSFWIGVTFLEGSIIFTISCFLACAPKETLGENREPVVGWAMLVGGLHYNICTYLMCIETANLKKIAGDAFTLNPFNAIEIIRMLEEAGIGPEPYIASITYFVGALVYAVPCVADLIEFHHTEFLDWLLFIGPYTFAGVCFCLGGLTECFDHEVFTTYPDNVGWWGAFLNFAGGAIFMIAGVVRIWSSWWMSFLFGVGCLIYTAGSVAMVIMWKDEQFGLTFLAAINDITRPPTASPHFSVRGIIFLFLYIVVGVMTVYNFNLALRACLLDPSVMLVGAAFNEGAPLLTVHMMMALLSANYRIPKEQPYHALMILARIALVILAFKVFITFYFSLIEDNFFFQEEGRDKEHFFSCGAGANHTHHSHDRNHSTDSTHSNHSTHFD